MEWSGMSQGKWDVRCRLSETWHKLSLSTIEHMDDERSKSILLDTVVAVSQLYVCSAMLSTCRGFTPVLSGVKTQRSSDGDIIDRLLH